MKWKAADQQIKITENFGQMMINLNDQFGFNLCIILDIPTLFYHL